MRSKKGEELGIWDKKQARWDALGLLVYVRELEDD